jgi:hypothetical protein
MWTALLAFAGGVLAVAMKGYVDLLLDRRREKRQVQVAARLVYEELYSASMGIETDLFVQQVPSLEHFSTSAWEEYSALLATELDFELWRLTVIGYDALRGARELCEAYGHAVRLEDLDDEDREKFCENLVDLQRTIANARGIVADLIKGRERDPFPGT